MSADQVGKVIMQLEKISAEIGFQSGKPPARPDSLAGKDGCKRWQPADWIALAAIAAIALVCFVPGLWSYGIIDPSDGLYAEAAREMLERGDWITPTSNYKPFFEKPILLYWMILGSYKLLGVSEFAARLPVAISGAANCAAIFVLTRLFLRRRAAFLSAIVLASLPLFAVVAHLSLTDVPLTFFMSSAILALFYVIDRSGRRSASVYVNVALASAYVLLGLVLLIKGPVPVALAGVVLASSQLVMNNVLSRPWHYGWRQLLASIKPMVGLSLMALIAVPWYAAETAITHGQFAQEFFIRQNVGRAVGSVNHQNPFWYYIPVFFGGFLPWSVLLLLQKKGLRKLISRRPSLTRRQALSLLSLVWLVTIVGIFSLLKTKLATYILPAAPAIAILAGITLDTLARRRRLPALALAALPLVASAVLVPVGLYFDYRHTHEPLRDLVARVRADRAALALYLRDSPAVCFYMKEPVTEIWTLLDYKRYAQAPFPHHYLLVSADVLSQTTYKHPSWKLLDKKGKWHLFAIDE